MSVLSAIKTWVDGADWRSWVAHSLVGVAVALVSRLIGVGNAANVWCTFVLFTVREAEQALLAVIAGQRPHWGDAVGDIVAPVIVVSVVLLSL
jgi:hypothetical protein